MSAVPWAATRRPLPVDGAAHEMLVAAGETASREKRLVPMTLYLSSTGLGARPAALRELMAGPRVGLIVNALDKESWRGRLSARRNEARQLRAIGCDPVEIDLRRYAGSRRTGARGLAGALRDLSAVWVSGGNTFVLLEAMQRSDFGTAVRGRLDDGGFVYAGYSAGACVAGPDIRGVEIMDEIGESGLSLDGDEGIAGLGLVDFRVVPHWRSGHPLSPSAEQLANSLQVASLPHRCLSDGQVVVVRDGVASLV
jgi:dipeptidase E